MGGSEERLMSETQLDPAIIKRRERAKKAITLAGGGPAAGLHIGALARLQQEKDINFDVWALSCIGAWVGIIHNQWPNHVEDKAKATYNFFRESVFRNNESYARFPLNSVFAPDLQTNTGALIKFLFDPKTYQGLLIPDELIKAAVESALFWCNLQNWDKAGDINHWVLNQALAVQPLSRFLTSLLYLSPMNGLSRIYYEDSSFLKTINIKRLVEHDERFIYHNAWNLQQKAMKLFSNVEGDGYADITTNSLCACSALPYIEGTVPIDGVPYSEGALIETVNFSRLIEDHSKLDEIWVSRIVDASQAEAPKHLSGALGNLCMLFAGSLGDDDVKLFQYHARDEKWHGTVYEINFAAKKTPEPTNYPTWMNVTGQDNDVNFDWNWRNLDNGVARGYRAVDELLNFRSCMNFYLRACVLGRPSTSGYDEALGRALDLAQRLTREDYALGQVARAVTFSRAAVGLPSSSPQSQAAQDAIVCLAKNTKMPWRNSRKRIEGIKPATRLKRELGKTFYNRATIHVIMQDLKNANLERILEQYASQEHTADPE
jgi:predicted acylesterase/phospholipase RssA